MSNIEPVPVLFADGHLVAVNKPSGMPCQPDPTGHMSLLDVVSAMVGGMAGMPHRLDRPVSGVCLFATTPDALRGMNAAFAGGRIRKTYWALVQGAPDAEAEVKAILRHDRARKKAVVGEQGRDVRLSYKRLVQGERFALLEVSPAEGAFHQIRALLASVGHPIAWDVKYGARRAAPDRSIGLHARSVVLEHPVLGGPLRIEAPPPVLAPWAALVEAIGKVA